MSKWNKTPLEDDDRPHDGKCAAYGCEQPGTMSHSTTGPCRDWVCRHHFWADVNLWQEVTRRLNLGLTNA
jgi:hypothetical protein